MSKSVATSTLSGFTAMVAKKWRGLSDAEKAVLAKLIECEETTPASAISPNVLNSACYLASNQETKVRGVNQCVIPRAMVHFRQ